MVARYRCVRGYPQPHHRCDELDDQSYQYPAGYEGHVSVTYHPGTPTAEAGYRWRIQFGGSIGRRVALHEMAHWLGSGTYGEWGNYMVDGRWRGAITNARIKAFDGPDAVQWGDRIHFWPYGLNYDNEFYETQRNVQLVSSQLGDMGLGDAATQFAGDRRFVNRSSKLLLDGTGTEPVAGSGTGATLTGMCIMPTAMSNW